MTPAEAIPKTIKVFQKTRYQKLRTETEAQIRASFSHSIYRDNTARRKRPIVPLLMHADSLLGARGESGRQRNDFTTC
jgi:hypothetical protein